MRRCSAFRALTTWLTGMCRVRFQKRDSYIANVSDLRTMDWGSNTVFKKKIPPEHCGYIF